MPTINATITGRKRMIAIEETAIVEPNGKLVLHNPQFKPGKQVKVIVLLGAGHMPEQRPKTVCTGRRLKGDWGASRTSPTNIRR